jgi:hypothetical protein
MILFAWFLLAAFVALCAIAPAARRPPTNDSEDHQ